jgi:hypothetical protein
MDQQTRCANFFVQNCNSCKESRLNVAHTRHSSPEDRGIPTINLKVNLKALRAHRAPIHTTAHRKAGLPTINRRANVDPLRAQRVPIHAVAAHRVTIHAAVHRKAGLPTLNRKAYLEPLRAHSAPIHATAHRKAGLPTLSRKVNLKSLRAHTRTDFVLCLCSFQSFILQLMLQWRGCDFNLVLLLLQCRK